MVAGTFIAIAVFTAFSFLLISNFTEWLIFMRLWPVFRDHILKGYKLITGWHLFQSQQTHGLCTINYVVLPAAIALFCPFPSLSFLLVPRAVGIFYILFWRKRITFELQAWWRNRPTLVLTQHYSTWFHLPSFASQLFGLVESQRKKKLASLNRCRKSTLSHSLLPCPPFSRMSRMWCMLSSTRITWPVTCHSVASRKWGTMHCS